MLHGVLETQGTGAKASLAYYSAGGKTGTAQRFDTATSSYLKNDYTSSFIGYFPLHEPRLLIMVIVDRPQGLINTGGMVAAPVFKRIAEQAGEYLNIQPDKGIQTDSIYEAPLEAHANPILRQQSGSTSYSESEMQEAAAAKFFDAGRNMEFKGAFKGLTVREVMTLAQKHGYEVVVSGSGFATGKVRRDRRVPTRLYVQFDHLGKRKM
jgi:cell division protein FtsI (penicillin-binding protein 3)